MIKSLTSALTLATVLLFSSIRTAYAFQLNPLSQVYRPTGADSIKSYEIVNNTDEPIAIEVSMALSEMSLTGEESLISAEDDFLVYPPQMILSPDETQTVRVTWLGDPNPAQELTYRLIAEQLPINLLDPEAIVPPQPRGEIKLSFRYVSTVFIRPQGVSPNVSLVSVESAVDESDQPQLLVTLENLGNGNARLNNWQLDLVSQGQTIQLTSESNEEISSRVILPGQKRQFTLDWPNGLPVGDVNATFHFTE